MKKYSCVLTDYSTCIKHGFKETIDLEDQYEWTSDEINPDVIKDQYKMLKDISYKLKHSDNILYLDDLTLSDRSDLSAFEVDEYKQSIKTSSYVGVIKYRDDEKQVNINIRSRFDKHNPSQDFLMYMIEKSKGLCIPEFSADTSPDAHWSIMLAIIFASQLKEAYHQGLFKTYTKFEYNDSKVKGTININRHIKKNIPFIGNVAYDLGENSEDNYIIYLIMHTYEKLKAKYPKVVDEIITQNSECHKAINAMQQSAPNFYSTSIQAVVNLSKDKINHPYFNKYEPLRKTCIMVLRDIGINIFDGNNEIVYGILAPVDKLWENFVGSEMIKRIHPNFEHHSDFKPLLVRSKNEICVKSRQFDFHLSGAINIDAKYKPIWDKSAKQSFRGYASAWKYLDQDIYQVLSYMYISNVSLGGVIFPSIYDETLQEFGLDEFKVMSEGDLDNKFYTIPVIIPKQTTNFKESFEKSIETTINQVIEKIKLI